MSDSSPSKDQLSHALERVVVYRKDPTTLLPYARSMIALVDEIDRLRDDVARYENGRVVLLGEIEELKKKLSARLQQIDDLKQLAVRQGNEIRKLRGPVRGEPV